MVERRRQLTGEVLADMRRARGLTQAHMAERLDWHLSQVSRAERQANWRVDTLVDYLGALRTEVLLRVTPSAGLEVLEDEDA